MLGMQVGANAIVVTDSNGRPFKVVQAGQTVEVGPGDERKIFSVSMVGGSGGDDGRPRCFNDQGQIVFTVRYHDGSRGVILATLYPASESGT